MSRQDMMQFYDDVCPLDVRLMSEHLIRSCHCGPALLWEQPWPCATTGCDTAEGFIVGFDLGNKGKGLVATRSFDKNEEVLRERPFVAVQSHDNMKEVLACANCFRFVGAMMPAPRAAPAGHCRRGAAAGRCRNCPVLTRHLHARTCPEDQAHGEALREPGQSCRYQHGSGFKKAPQQ
jgi:hypothetical protein